MLKLNFGEGHSWSVNFNASGKTYEADSIVFSYSLKDKKLFPNAVSNGNPTPCSPRKLKQGRKISQWHWFIYLFIFSDTKTVTVTPHITEIGLDTCYSCKSTNVIENTSVNQTLWNVLIQAFVSNNSKSDNSKCTCRSTLHPYVYILN